MIIGFLNVQLTNNPWNPTLHPTINRLISDKNWINYLFTTHKTILRFRYQLIQNLFQAVCQNLSQDLVYTPNQANRSKILDIGGTILLRG